MILCYDTVNPDFLGGVPADAQAIAFYLDGAYANQGGARNRFPNLFKNGHVIGYTVRGRVPAAGDDFESGNWMGDIGTWVQACVQMGVWRPVIYADGSDMANTVWPELERVFGSPLAPPGIGRRFRTIIANPDGDPTIPPEHDGKQYWWGAIQGGGSVDMDINSLRDDFFSRTPTPPEGTVDIATNGQGFPHTELFVILNDGSVKHIGQDETTKSKWWEDAKGNLNWLSLGNPSKPND